MIRQSTIDQSDLRRIESLLPGPDPPLMPLPAELHSRGVVGPAIPVASTKLDGNEMRYVTECLRSGWISSQGQFVERFEKAFASRVECCHAVACSSGTAALHLALATLGIGSGDEVIVPAFSMIAVPNAVSHVGATPVAVDAEPHSWNIDVSKIAARITSRTKAIIVVHTYGHPVDMAPVWDLARRNGLRVIEDAAEAHGAEYGGRKAGSLGDVATFSFYANKIINTGEGGMLTTNDARIAEVARRLRDHAFSSERHFWHAYRGFNYRMTSLQAAVGVAQTERFDALVRKRRDDALRYSQRLQAVAHLTLPGEREDTRNVFWMYGLLVGDDFGCSRDELRGRLAAGGVETRTFFIPIHLQPIYFQQYRGQRFPVAEDLCRRGLYLPSGPTLTDWQIDYICGLVAKAGLPQQISFQAAERTRLAPFREKYLHASAQPCNRAA